jgi:hypothetical protein
MISDAKHTRLVRAACMRDRRSAGSHWGLIRLRRWTATDSWLNGYSALSLESNFRASGRPRAKVKFSVLALNSHIPKFL